MSTNKKTIKDIAKMAGVSPGTVDRVIHNRGKVSEEKKASIEKVLEEIDYEPNVIAKTLKNNKIRNIAVIMPDPNNDSYWAKAALGLNTAKKDFGSFGLNNTGIHFDQRDINSYQKATEKALEQAFDGVLLVPMYPEATIDFLNRCQEQKLPVITFNTIPDSHLPSCLIGQDLYQSGRVGASLMVATQKSKGDILLVHIDETPDNAPHIFDKQRGFLKYLEEINYDMNLVKSIDLFHNSDKSIVQQLNDKTPFNSNVSGAFISTSRVYEVAESLKALAPELTIIGYDLVAKNVDLLRNNVINYLIDQNPARQAYRGMSKFSDLLVFQKEIDEKDFLPLHIAFKENIDSLLENRIMT